MRTTRHSVLLVAAVASLVLMAGCAPASFSSSTTPPSNSAGSVSQSPSPSDSGDPRSSVIPGVVPAPHWPIPGIDAGNTATPSPGSNGAIDMAWGWGSLGWSPDGTTLAAAAESQELGEGQIHLFDRTGHPAGAVPGWQAVWIDDHDLMTLERNVDGTSYSAWSWSKDAKTSALVTSNAIDLLASSLGAVAITQPSSAIGRTFRIWNKQGLSEALPGTPVDWSADGRRLAVLRDASAAIGSTSPSVILAAGGAGPMWLQVLDGSNRHQLAAFPRFPFDPRTRVLFDLSGTLIATSAFVFDLTDGAIQALPARREAVAWGTDRRLILASFDDHTVAAWDPTTHTLGATFVPGTRLRTSDHQLVTVPTRTGDLPQQLVPPGVMSPDGALRAWYPLGNGTDPTALWLVSESGAGP